jgi:hypothetical protein
MIVRNLMITASNVEFIAKTGFGDPVQVQNLGTGSLYIGSDSSVDDASGLLISGSLPFDLKNYSGNIWGFALTNDCDVRVIEEIVG